MTAMGGLRWLTSTLLSWRIWGFSLVCLAPAQQAVSYDQMPKSVIALATNMRPMVVAHRGRLEPSELENCLSQFQATVGAGPFMLEMDLRRSHDGHVYLMHDPTLDRTTDEHGPIDAKSSLQLAKVRLRYPNGRIGSETIPEFAAVLKWAAERQDVYLMLDLKNVDPGEVVAMVRKAGLQDRVILLTFDSDLAKRTLAVTDHETVSVLVKTKEDISKYAQMRGQKPLALYLPQDADPSLFRIANAAKHLVITDAVTLDGATNIDAQAERNGPLAYKTYLATHPAAVFVTNYPREAERALASNP